MKRTINIIKAIPAFELKTKTNDLERKYHSDIEKKKKIKKEVNKDEIKYFIHL